MTASSPPPARAGLLTGLAADASPGEPLAPWTSLRVGGPAELLVRPRSADALVRLLARAKAGGIPVHVLGGGANTLVGDLGIPGVTLKLPADLFPEEIQPAGPGDGGLVTLGAGAAIARLINVMRTRGWVGAEFLAGIPGTIGGAVAMNAGTKQGECKRVLDAVELATPDGIGWVTRSALTIRYRHTELPAGRGAHPRPLPPVRGRHRGLARGDGCGPRVPQAHPAAQPAELRQRLPEPPGGPRRPADRVGRPQGDGARRRAESRRCTRTGSSTSARPAPRTWSDSSSARESACARPRASCSCRR